jgi:hypothetical protein
VLSLLAWLVALTIVTVLVALIYRIGAQLSASADSGGLPGVLYAASALPVAPFSRFETVTPVRDGSVFEFATLVAIEAYLLFGFLLIVTLAAAAVLAQRYAPRRWSRRVELQSVLDTWRSLEPSLAALSADAEAGGLRLLEASARMSRRARSSTVWAVMEQDAAVLRRAATTRIAELSRGEGRTRMEREISRLRDVTSRGLAGVRSRLERREEPQA